MTDAVAKLEGVTRKFASGTYGCRDVTLTVPAGHMIAIVGKSGSGKSTLLNILGLLDNPDHGTYELMGTDTARCTAKQLAGLRASYLGFVFQAFHLQSRRSVLDNVQMGSLYRGTRAARRRETSADILARLGLETKLQELPAVLSGGERQRVAIARALVSGPPLLLCDEPTGNLDSANGREVMNVLTELTEQGTTVLVVTHDPDVAGYAHTTYRMHDGRSSSEESPVG